MLALVAVAACYRITRLLVVDDILDRPRRAMVQWLASRSGRTGAFAVWVIDLSVCPWCVSVWVAAAMVAAGVGTGWVDVGTGWAAVVGAGASWMALSAAAAILWVLVERVSEDDEDEF